MRHEFDILLEYARERFDKECLNDLYFIVALQETTGFKLYLFQYRFKEVIQNIKIKFRLS